MPRTPKIAALAFVALVGTSAAPVSAAEVDASSQVKLTYKGVTRSLKGRVEASTETVCAKGRVVKLIQIKDTGNKKVLKKTKTTKTGRYSFRMRRSGRYQAIVMPKAVASSYGDLVSCAAAKSKVVKVR